MNNHSPAKNAQATTVDNMPPEFAISVLQNPYLSSYLDIYVMASEALIDTSFTVTVGGEEVDVSPCPGQDLMFRYDHEIYAGGPLNIRACGRDFVMNRGCSSSVFNAVPLSRQEGGEASSLNGRLSLSIPPGALRRDTYLLIGETQDGPESVPFLYTVSPASAGLNGRMTVAISYPDDVPDAGHLCIARIDDGAIQPLESYLDAEGGRVLAYTNRLGAFGLLERPEIETPDYYTGDLRLYPGIPNPFSRSTTVSFALPGPGPVSVKVYSADGRLVRELLDAPLGPGRHSTAWDGTNGAGARAAGGIYFVRVSTPAKAATGKLILLP
jgi:hypothetical protein